MDGEVPDLAVGGFDLIASSLAMQWFVNLRDSIGRLADLLAPGGRLIFATLGADSFAEWRMVHATLGLTPGLHSYPPAESFPWPALHSGMLEVETIQDHHTDGQAFIRSLKDLGAGEPSAGHKPLTVSRHPPAYWIIFAVDAPPAIKCSMARCAALEVLYACSTGVGLKR